MTELASASGNLTDLYFKQSISWKKGLRLQELNIAIGFVVLWMKGFMCGSAAFWVKHFVDKDWVTCANTLGLITSCDKYAETIQITHLRQLFDTEFIN
jgi:hypothetical protein